MLLRVVIGGLIGGEKEFVKDWPYGFLCLWESELVSCSTNLLGDDEGSIALVAKFLGWSIHLQVVSF